MFKRISCIIILLLFLVTTLTGCYDAREIDDEVYALAIGIDKGIDNKVRVSIQYPIYKSGSEGGGGEKGQDSEKKGESSSSVSGTNIHTIDASSILEAIDMFGMFISRRVSLMHAKELIFSEAFAREGVEKYLAPMARFRDTRRTMAIIVTKGTAVDYLKENKPDIGESLAKSMELIGSQVKNTGLFPRAIFGDFYTSIVSTFGQSFAVYSGVNNFDKLLPETSAPSSPPLVTDKGFLPGEIPREGVTKREFAGTAVFEGDKMIGTLDSYETRFFLMIIGQYRSGIIDIKDKESPQDVIVLDTRPSRSPQVKGHFENGKPVIDLKVRLEADIGSIQSRINYENINKLQQLNKQAEEYIKENLVKVINKVQKQYKSDIFHFGQKFAGYFSTIQEWEKYNWLSHFPDAKVNVSVEFNIRRTGLMINSSPVHGISQ